MFFKLVIGRHGYRRTKSFAQCVRILLEEYGQFIEVGTAYIERDDGAVVARFDLDLNIPANR